MLIESQAILRVMNEMSELKEKLLESTGVDDDMQPVTLRDLLSENISGN